MFWIANTGFLFVNCQIWGSQTGSWCMSKNRICEGILTKADEIFLTGTAVEITPITQIDNKKFNVGEITKKLISLFSDLVEKN